MPENNDLWKQFQAETEAYQTEQKQLQFERQQSPDAQPLSEQYSIETAMGKAVPNQKLGSEAAIDKLHTSYKNFASQSASLADGTVDFVLSPAGQRMLIESGVVMAETAALFMAPEIIAATKARQLGVAVEQVFEMLPGVVKPVVNGLMRFGADYLSGAVGSLAAEGVDPSVNPSERANSAGAWNVFGGAAGKSVAYVKKNMLAPFSSSVKESTLAVDAMLREKDSYLSASQMSDNSLLQLIDSIGEAAFTLGSKREISQTGRKLAASEIAEDFAEAFVKSADVDTLGVVIKKNLSNSADIFRSAMKRQYKALDDLIEPEYKTIIHKKITTHDTGLLDSRGKSIIDTITEEIPERVISKGGVKLNNVFSTVKAFQKETPNLKSTAGQIHSFLNDVLEQPEIMTFAEAQNLRSFMLDYTPDPTGPLFKPLTRVRKHIIDDVTKAMEGAGKELDTGAYEQWRAVSEAYKAGSERFNTNVARTIARQEPEAVYRAIVKARSPGTIKRANALFKNETDGHTMNLVRGYFLQDLLGTAAQEGGAISGLAMQRTMRKYGAETVSELFPTQLPELNRMISAVTLADREPGAHAFQFIVRGAQIGAILGIGSAISEGEVTGIGAGSGSILISAEFLGHAMKNKSIIKWLTQGFHSRPGTQMAIEAATKLTTAYQGWKARLSEEQKKRVVREFQTEALGENVAPVLPMGGQPLPVSATAQPTF